MKVFSIDWFKHNQFRLLRFANTRFGKWILEIPYKHNVVHICPSSYSHIHSFDGKQINCMVNGWSNNVFAHRLRKKLAPIWWTMHFTDWAMLDRFKPLPSFGFTTLAEEPSTGNTDPWDANYYKVISGGTNWATVRAYTSCDSALYSSTYVEPAMNWYGSDPTKIDKFIRGVVGYDLSVIKPFMKITEVNSYFKVYMESSIYNPLGDPTYLSGGYTTYWSDVNLGIAFCPFTPYTTSAHVNDYNITRYDTSTLIARKTASGFNAAPSSTIIDMQFGIGYDDLVHLIRSYYSYFGVLFEADRANVDPVEYNTVVSPGTDFYWTASSADNLTHPPLSIHVVYAPDTIQINVGDAWKNVADIQINVGDSWKSVSAININTADVWRDTI